jgi:hypothetical protein
MTEMTVSKQEWRWVIIWAVSIMLITLIPYLYGWSLSTPQTQFSGFFIGVEDANSYLAKMLMGAKDGWLFHLPFTSEPHPGVFLFTFHLLLGKISTATGLPPTLTYHLARVILGLLFLGAAYQFIAAFTDNIKVRKVAFLLVGLGSGLGWLVIVTGWADRIGLPLEIYLPEGFNFLILLHLPHLLMAEILLLGGFLLLLRAWQVERKAWLWAVCAGLTFFLALVIAAFYLVVIVAVLAVTLLLHWWLIRRLPWTEIGLAALAVAITLPIALYNFWVFTSIPVFQVLGQQNIVRSPAPVHYILAYGVLVVLAIPGIKVFWHKQDPYGLFLIAWVVAVPLLVYLPFNLQRRLVMGVQLPLSILAATGLFHLCQTRVKLWRQSSLGLVIFSSLTNIFLLVGGLVNISAQQPPIFHPTTQVEAIQWLAHTANGEVVLAVYETGNILPAYANVRAFVGHGPETIYSDEKQAQARQFFSGTTGDEWRRELLKKFNVRYVYYGPDEKAAGDFAPGQVPYLHQVYKNEAVQIFEVKL